MFGGTRKRHARERPDRAGCGAAGVATTGVARPPSSRKALRWSGGRPQRFPKRLCGGGLAT
eukprot:13190490-Alexandrium_andersonii.AAC.1